MEAADPEKILRTEYYDTEMRVKCGAKTGSVA
jgi:hypothetical protein